MANVASIEIRFETADCAQRALAVTERMIKLEYIPKELPWAEEAEGISSLSGRYFRFGGKAAALDPLREHPNCALKWLRRDGERLILKRCADIQSPVDVSWPKDFFTQLCLTLSKCFPDERFCAVCRHEETVSATVQLNRIRFDQGRLLCEEMWRLEDERDENDWSDAYSSVLHETDGVIDPPARQRF